MRLVALRFEGLVDQRCQRRFSNVGSSTGGFEVGEVDYQSDGEDHLISQMAIRKDARDSLDLVYGLRRVCLLLIER
jgi:hypothetical protein